MTAIRSILAAVVFSLAGGLAAAQPQTQTQTPHAVRFDVPAQPLNKALNAFARQSDLRIVFYTDVAEGVTSPAINGTLTPEHALKKLLANSNLTYEFVNERTISIRMLESKLNSEAQTSSRIRGSDEPVLTLARTATGTSVATAEARTDSQQSTEARQRTGESEAENKGKGIPAILVRGARSSNTDIRRTEDDVQPYVVFSAEQIERSMAGSLHDFLHSRLPMNAVQGSASLDPESDNGNRSSINLRGRGANQTLILVNGRRLPRVADLYSDDTPGDFGQADINGIPLASVERIEILPSTASGIYGGGATGGVINIVLKSNYSGVEVTGTYENLFDTDAARRRVDLNGGFTLEGGKTSVLLSGSYSTGSELLLGDRDFVQRSRRLILTNEPDAAATSFVPPDGYTSNYSTLNRSPLILDDTYGGATLDTWFGSVPVAYAGLAADGLAPLQALFGQYNLDVPNDVLGNRQTFVNDPTLSAFSVSIRRDFGERFEAFADLSMYDNEGRGINAGLPLNVTLLADAPNNPFQNDIRVTYPKPGYEFDWHSTTETRQAAGGLRLRLPGNWSVQGDYSWNRSRFHVERHRPVVTAASRTDLAVGLLDVMRDANEYPLDFSGYFISPGRPTYFVGPADTVLREATVRIAGPALRLPGGALTLSAQLARRTEDAEGSYLQDYYTPAFSQTDMLTASYAPPRSQVVDSAYLEALLPLFSARNARPFVRELQVQASVRRDKYETTTPSEGVIELSSPSAPLPGHAQVSNNVASTDFTLGLRYAPSEDIALRVSYGTGFLPPSVAQLVTDVDPAGYIVANDPQRGDVFYVGRPYPIIMGGNPDLDPEESQSWSVGAILTPRLLSGLRFSVDYTRTEKTDEIASLTFTDIFRYEEFFPGRLTRAELTQDDIDMGYTGGVAIAGDLSLANLASTLVESFDFRFDYSLDLGEAGTLGLYTLATLQTAFERQLTEGLPTIDAVGYTGGLLKWRSNGGLFWERGGWSMAWNAQYYDSYLVYGAGLTPSQEANQVSEQGTDTIPSQIYHDVSFRYRFDPSSTALHGWLADTEIQFGISNVFDKAPPILATVLLIGAQYSTYGDPRLRRYSISLRKRL